MKEKLLKKGTPVRLTSDFYASYNTRLIVASGRTGKVLRYTSNGTKIGIEFNSPVKYSGNCHGFGQEGYCVYIPVEMVKSILNYNVGDIIFLTESIGGIPKGHKMEIEQLTQRDYAPYVVTTQFGTSRLIVTESQISKQEPIQILDIKSTQDKYWVELADLKAKAPDHLLKYPLIPKELFKSSKPMLAASLLVLNNS